MNYFFVLSTINRVQEINEGKMANNRITEGVGKKIVEALKMQSDVEITTNNDTIQSNFVEQNSFEQKPKAEIQQNSNEFQEVVEQADDFNFDDNIFNEPEEDLIKPEPIPQFNIPKQTTNIPNDLDDFEIPSNVAVLKQLISKLPTGVTKQTGAMIIKQTMEALGISMKSVLQEAQQVQEGLNNSARECQSSIMEYKKQIGILEKQAQKYQRQYAALNDIISLFVQTNI